jgi:hypothetical protein
MVQMTGASYSAGIEEVVRDGASLKVYSVANVMRPYLEAVTHE